MMKPINPESSLVTESRNHFHEELVKELLVFTMEEVQGNKPRIKVASNADKKNQASIRLANAIGEKLGAKIGNRLKAQTSGSKFEEVVQKYLEDSFLNLSHLRPGMWDVYNNTKKNEKSSTKKGEEGKKTKGIGRYSQYSHLVALQDACDENPALAASLGNDYLISPDIVIVRNLESDSSINRQGIIVDDKSGFYADIREGKDKLPILHASISTKWTLRSDRAQNSRSEALNLIRNRKGRQPHIAVVTGEPTPSRISSLALGTGDIDCVYHVALYELSEAVKRCEGEDSQELLQMMIDGKRLKDISDLPLDLAI